MSEEETNELSNTLLKILCIKDEINYEWSNIISKLNTLFSELDTLKENRLKESKQLEREMIEMKEEIRYLKMSNISMKAELLILQNRSANSSQVSKYQCIIFSNTIKSTVNADSLRNKSFTYKTTVKNRISKSTQEDSHWIKNYIVNEEDYKQYHNKLMTSLTRYIIDAIKSFPITLTYQEHSISIKIEISSNEISSEGLGYDRPLVGWLCQDILFDNSKKIEKILTD